MTESASSVFTVVFGNISNESSAPRFDESSSAITSSSVIASWKSMFSSY